MSAEVLEKTNAVQRRFFYHYNKQQKRMTVHWKGQCILTDEIVCKVPAETKTSDRQPQYVLQGWASDVVTSLHTDGRTYAYII